MKVVDDIFDRLALKEIDIDSACSEINDLVNEETAQAYNEGYDQGWDAGYEEARYEFGEDLL